MWSSWGGGLVLLGTRLIGRFARTCLLVDLALGRDLTGAISWDPQHGPLATWASLQHGACVPRVSEERERMVEEGGGEREKERERRKTGREEERVRGGFFSCPSPKQPHGIIFLFSIP